MGKGASMTRSLGQLPKARRIVATLGVLSVMLAGVPMAAATPDDISSTAVVSDISELTAAAVQAADITGTARANRLLADHVNDTGAPSEEAGRFLVYDFGVTTLVVDAATRFRVIYGRNADGQEVRDVVLSTWANDQQ